MAAYFIVNFYIYLHRFVKILRGESTEILMAEMVPIVKIIATYS